MAEQWANMQELGASLATRLKAVKEDPDFETGGEYTPNLIVKTEYVYS